LLSSCSPSSSTAPRFIRSVSSRAFCRNSIRWSGQSPRSCLRLDTNPSADRKRDFQEFLEEKSKPDSKLNEGIHLARVREALRVAPSRSGHAHGAHPVPDLRPSTPESSPRRWLPEVGESFEDRLTLFSRNAADLKANFVLLNHRNELSKALIELRDGEAWKKIGSHRGELTDAACEILRLPICRTDQTYEVKDLESCDAGITECDALIAQTGSVLVTGQSAGGRALSVLPRITSSHPSRSTPCPDLPDAFALLRSANTRRITPASFPSSPVPAARVISNASLSLARLVEEADDFVRINYASSSLITCPPVWLNCLKRPA
jgi:L-lactate dehydrogenase complex protein LldG